MAARWSSCSWRPSARLARFTPTVHYCRALEPTHSILNVVCVGSTRGYAAPAGGSSNNNNNNNSSSTVPSASASASPSNAAASKGKRTFSTSAAYQRQRRTEWGVIAVAGSAAALSGWWYWYRIRPKRAAAAAAAQQHTVQQNATRSFSLSSRTSFSIASRSASAGSTGAGGAAYKIITSLTPSEVDRVLRENERSTTVDRPARSCLVARYDTNSVASNDPIEDKRAEVIVERDTPVYNPRAAAAAGAGAVAAPLIYGDLCFFAVMDGHAGYATSTLLSQKLIAFVALELDKVFREKGEYAQIAKAKAAMPGSMWSMLFGASGDAPSSLGTTISKALVARGGSASKVVTSSPPTSPPAGCAGLDGDPDIVRRAIAKAFKSLDKEICNTPIELLKEYEISLAASKPAVGGGGSINSRAAPSRVVTAASSSGAGSSRSLSSLAHSIFPSNYLTGSSFTQTQRTAYEAILPALSGSCALLTYIDSARGDLYVACTGDSRAIAGWWREKEGRWEIEPLSVDQTGRNEAEAKRMRSEHPVAEADTVIMRGRVLGGLEPTRAFGDARYKWDRSLQERLYEAFLPGGRASARPPPKYLQTPPYVTAEPVIEVRKISSGLLASPSPAAASFGPEDLASAAESAPPERDLKFVVMATDGLWDMMSNEEVGSLVAGHLAGLKGDVLASTLQAQCFPSPAAAAAASKGAGAPPVLSPPGSARGAAASQANQQPNGGPDASALFLSQVQQKQQQRDAGHPLNRAPQHLKTFTFEDTNISTHLIRNALGGAQRERVAGLLAIPAPESRSYRDDITVNVILFNDSRAPAQAANVQDGKESETLIKSKL
ncbi:protein serine/threonine phosphatase 2C [Tilletiaria anomala UBC 951]|uniref:Protein serine/threonine phosphatase 2C n=1 Tax=Tilletiaria anomala (strain ATCC 24038 / CBS 436.72 / UBC 951) TaxID=1037660 RepID=A0A066V7J4_TILAU|nr:protein serine/threonine phosphatase 2C [Tilletiaria anomala UBC 951]KDN37421.1 protein serine/threonine phosphatase 2C [Tilletiaria anomala UBC 951]